jgi:hypothetical protein
MHEILVMHGEQTVKNMHVRHRGVKNRDPADDGQNSSHTQVSLNECVPGKGAGNYNS